MDIQCSVEGQKLVIQSKTKHFPVGSNEFVRFLFRFSPDWEGLTAFAQFRQKDRAENIYLDDDNSVTLPGWLQPGYAIILLYGTGINKTIGTTNSVLLRIDHTGLLMAETDIPESLYQQLVNRVIGTEAVVNANKRKLDGIDEGANRYVLPTASDITLGGIKVGDGLSIDGGVLETDVKSDDLTDYREAWEDLLSELPLPEDTTLIPLATSTTKGGFILNPEQFDMDEGVLKLKDEIYQDYADARVDEKEAYAREYADWMRDSFGHVYPIYTKSRRLMHTFIQNENNEIEQTGVELYFSDLFKAPKRLCIDFADSDYLAYIYFYLRNGDSYDITWDLLNETRTYGGEKRKNLLRMDGASPEHSGIIDIEQYVAAANESRGSENMIDINDVYICVASTLFHHDPQPGIPDPYPVPAPRDVCKFYGWDGDTYGVRLAVDAAVPDSDGTKKYFFERSVGLTIPRGTRAVICDPKNAKIRTLYAYFGELDGDNQRCAKIFATDDDNATGHGFVLLPQYNDDKFMYYRVRINYVTNEPSYGYDDIAPVGDCDFINIVAKDTEILTDSFGAAEVIENNCRNITGLKWTPAKNLPYKYVSGNPQAAYKAGIEYNGIPYGSGWDYAHFVYWHVSPHTYINAARDKYSWFFSHRSGNNDHPFYSLVCSPFASLVTGATYPQTNAGYLYDPHYKKQFMTAPQPGRIVTDVYTDPEYHCRVSAERYKVNGVMLQAFYEETEPMSARTIKYRSIKNGELDQSARRKNVDNTELFYMNVTYDDYQMAIVKAPYTDIDNAEVVPGTAKPDKGDKCVYTSDETNVYIHITDPTALYLKLAAIADDAPDIQYNISLAEAEEIDPEAADGVRRIDIHSYLTDTGIYAVWTDTDDDKQYFEFRDLDSERVNVNVSADGKLSVTDSSGNPARFWYLFARMVGSHVIDKALDGEGKPNKQPVCVPCEPDGDYSAWYQDGHRFGHYEDATTIVSSVEDVFAVFCKGQFGAYVVWSNDTEDEPSENDGKNTTD